jgi:hypothetical protein
MEGCEVNELSQLLKEAMTGESPTLAFRASIKRRLNEGASRDAVLAELETLRESVDDAQQDVILEILDFFHGWCPPEMRL